MTFLSKFSLRFLVISACLFFGLTPLVIFSVFAWKSADLGAVDQAATLEAAAANLADKIDRNLFERYGDVQAFGLNHAVRDREAWYQPGDENPIVQAMNSYVDTYDIYYFTLLVDLEGKLIAVNTRDDSGNPVDTAALYEQNFSDTQWFQDCIAGRFYESDDGSFTGTVVEHLYVDPLVAEIYGDEGLSLGYSAPVYGENGEIKAVWKNVTKFGLVEEIVQCTYDELNARGLASTEVTLLDKLGNVIVDCDPLTFGSAGIQRDLNVIGKFNLADKGVEAAERVVAGETGSLLNSYHARKKINQVAGFAPHVGALGFPGMEWNVLVRVDTAEILAAVNATKQMGWIIFVVAAAVIALAAWYFSGVLCRDLSKVVQSMDKATQDDFSDFVNCNSSADTARMSEGLNTLLNCLGQSELVNADYRGKLDSIGQAQAVIEFNLDGTVIEANENFLNALGYSLEEIQGKHHRMFVDPAEANSPEYEAHWKDLSSGMAKVGEFRRIKKDGSDIWIQASYSAVNDINGNPAKVVKFASDITATKLMELEIARKQEEDKKTAEEQGRKVDQLLQVVNAVAAGDMSVTMPDLGDDAVGQVATGVGAAVKSIREALSQVREVAGTVATNARELAQASDEISNGAQTQASSLEETAASLEQITATVKQNTDNSQQAQQLSASSREVAESGGQVVGEAVGAMTSINAASKKIAEIITTIDEIAFQTNLLALNAAVEAARAGEQGRGFAVVASEVRNLAQRSAGAAKEIKSLIQDSVRKVENGTELVNKSGETLEEIVTSVKRVADIVSEISAASSEQLSGVEQVNGAVSQMDRVTQTNAAQTEEMAGTSQSLLTHSEQLQQLVAAFKLGDDFALSTPAPIAAEPASTEWAEDATTESGEHELDLIGVGADDDADFIEF